MLNILAATQPLSQLNAAIFRQQYSVLGQSRSPIRTKHPTTTETEGNEHEYPSEECSSKKFPPLSGADSTVVNRRKVGIS